MDGKYESQVPVLITWDVDPSPRISLEHKKLSLDIATGLCSEFDIRSTFFVTAQAEQATSDELRRIHSLGHEIGCHGLTHGDEENYDRMPEAMQRAYIEAATHKLQALTSSSIRVFRSPRVKTSVFTLRLLTEMGYWADSSVCSQRIDFVSSNLINTGWIFSPRNPYHPHEHSAFRKGEIPIWEVPVSALVVPFISASLGVFGLSLMKVMFRLLYAESKLNGKPIVYLAHPTEFTVNHRRKYELREFSPAYVRAHGFILRTMLYSMNKETWLSCSRKLFAYMASLPGVTFMTCSEYIQYLNQSDRTASA